jgi:hypothetical protein
MIKFLIPVLVALESADGIFTYFKVGKDLVKEANPLLQSIAGTDSFLIMKICGALLCGILLWLVYKRFPRISLITTSSIALFYTAVLAWNLCVLL